MKAKRKGKGVSTKIYFGGQPLLSIRKVPPFILPPNMVYAFLTMPRPKRNMYAVNPPRARDKTCACRALSSL